MRSHCTPMVVEPLAPADERDSPKASSRSTPAATSMTLPPLADGLIAAGYRLPHPEAHRDRQIVGYRLLVHTKDRCRSHRLRSRRCCVRTGRD